MSLTDYDPSLQRIARFMPYKKPMNVQRLRRIRRSNVLLDTFLRVPKVDVVQLSPTVTARVHRPALTERPTPAVLHLHGGGYIMSSAMTEDRSLRRTAQQLGAMVVSVDYRLAPEHPYPAALDDCYLALDWLLAQPDIDPTRIVVTGISAGAGLATALALRCADNAVANLRGQVLVYPMLDDRTVTRQAKYDHRVWTASDNAFAWRSYLAAEPGSEGVDAYAAPARREDLSGLPPTWIGVGTMDLFYDECIAYAARLRATGVPTQLEVVEGAFHAFDALAPRSPIARRFTFERLAATRRFLAAP
jgi:acetyl esterase/lipase